MKKLLLGFLTTACLSAHSAGIITHTIFSDKSVSPATTPEVQAIIKQYYDDFIVGSDYPDTGYAFGAKYGEDTHWAPFMNAFMRHIDDKGGIEKNKRLVSFLFGIHSHNASDILWHWGFISETSECSGMEWEEVHKLADIDLEFAIASEHFGYFPAAPVWSIPVNDLTAVYKRMGLNHNADEIIHSNQLYYLVVLAEHFIMQSELARTIFINHAQDVFPACGYNRYPGWMDYTYGEVDKDRELLWQALLSGGDVVDYPIKPMDNKLTRFNSDSREELKRKLKLYPEMINWVNVEEQNGWSRFSFDEAHREEFEKWLESVIKDL